MTLWKPQYENDFPTLGWHVADQMAEYLAQPDLPYFKPFVPTMEQQDFLNELYRLDPVTGARTIHRAVLSRVRGWGKSPFLAGIGIAEAMFEVLFDGWDAQGQPVAKPWSEVRTPLVVVTAVNEDQVANTWDPLLEMLRNGSAVDEFNCDPMEGFVSLDRGRIEPRTLSPDGVKGARAVCALMDQTETWTRSNRGVQFAQALRNNATKLGGMTIESPNAFTIGQRSVAEASAKFWSDIQSGKLKHLDEGDIRSLYYDHRSAPASTQVGDRESLIHGLRVAYGDSANHPDGCVIHKPACDPGWAPIGRIATDFWDTSNDINVMRADFLNQIDTARDSYVTEPELRAIIDEKKIITSSEPITLGFDGSEGRKRGVADSTVLVGYSVTQRHFFKIAIWEQPEGPKGEDWRPPKLEIEAAVKAAFNRFNVVGFYADPSAGWAGEVKTWEATYHKRLKVKMSPNEPIRWMQKNVTRTAETFENLYSAILARDITFDGDQDLIKHFMNARRDPRRNGYVLKKPDDDPDFSKIDLTWGVMFAFAAGTDALGKKLTSSRPRKAVIRRIK